MNTSTEFDLTFKQVEECSKELAELHRKSTAAFFRTSRGVAVVRGALALFFSLFLAVPFVAVFATDVKLERWIVLYFIAVAWILGAISMSLAVQPVNVDVLESLLFTKGKRFVEITDEGLKCRINATTSMTSWSSYSGVALSQRYIFLAQVDGLFDAIPLASFSTQQVADEFAIEANKQIKAHRTITMDAGTRGSL